ncbi:DUF6573 family protein [Endozoicomonas sp. ONNA1]|uniref:DUF6573 family protein n=1 Tax=Endozoicomonas sp. ONNA1 TaxID=2828740 RepID=UPI00214768B7|nr:DUF6573 family protein [Endozoicomonas sp. ONNA1]
MSFDRLFDTSNIVSIYTRAEAIADGVLIDVTSTAKLFGFLHNTCITANVAAGCGRCEAALNEFLLTCSVKVKEVIVMGDGEASRIYFDYSFPDPDEGQDAMLKTIIHVGPGDRAEPVYTIMTPSDV